MAKKKKAAGPTLRLGRQFRTLALKREAVNVEQRTMEVAFSSEMPVERWFGEEVLGHGPGECDLGWLSGGTAPLLCDHDTGCQIGVVERAWIGNDQIGRALVRFGTSDEANQQLADCAAGIRANVSVGYQIEEMQIVSTDGEPGEADEAVYRATKWTPLEVSLVAIPADMSVGVGRDAGPAPRDVPIIDTRKQKERAMPEPVVVTTPAATVAPPVPPVVNSDEIIKAERQRIADIEALGQRHNKQELARQHIAKGTSLELFRGVLLEAMPASTPLEAPAAELGMSEKEAREFSLVRMILAQATAKTGGANVRDIAPFEAECSAEVAKKLDRSPSGFFVPLDVQRVKMAPARRDLTVGTNSAGGYTVSTDLRSQDFIELLRNAMMVRAMGARVLTGLVGNVAFPKLTAASTAYWVAESGAPTEGNQTFGQVTMSPKTLAAYTDMSRLLLKQSSIDIENLVRSDLATIIGIAADLAAIHGTGSSNQPTGIASTSGIGSVAIGTDGGAPTWASIVALESAVTVANAANGALGYLTNAKVRGKLKTVLKNASGTDASFIWPDTPFADGRGMVNGYPCGVSNQVSSTLTKGSTSGTCSAMFFGNWADLLIGEWGVLDVLVNPYTGATAGDVRIHTFMSMDIAVRHAASFAADLDYTTT